MVFVTPRIGDSKHFILQRCKVKWWDNKKGLGFIAQESGQDVFVHHTAIQGGGYKSLEEGERVEFSVERGPKGLQATQVERL